jgi:AcrR family transcriptional regulator
MPRAALSESELDQFREALCDSATRLFAENGYEGVTMRALATDLGCSPMTPYRYFENKAQIFEAVQTAASTRFANALEAAHHKQQDHLSRLRALCWSYVRFALDEPHAYRIMFELDQAERPQWPRNAEEPRGWLFMHAAVEAAVADNAISGDPDILAHLFWSGVHGLVALHLSGMLVMGRGLEELVEAFIDRQLDVSSPAKWNA